MGIFRGSQGLAFIIGPILGGTLAHFFSLYTPFYVDFSLTILGILLFLFLVPEMERKHGKFAFPLKYLGFFKQNLILMRIAFIGFSETFAFAALYSFVPALAIRLMLSEVEIAMFFTAEAIVFTLTNVIVGILSDKIGRKPIMIIGLACSSINLIAFFLQWISGRSYF